MRWECRRGGRKGIRYDDFLGVFGLSGEDEEVRLD